MLQKMRNSRDGTRKVSPPQPVFMSDCQKSEYLMTLRNDRPPRPVGSRPLPIKALSTPPPTKNPAIQTEPTPSLRSRPLDSASVIQTVDVPAGDPDMTPLERGDASAGVKSSLRSRASIGRPLAEVQDQQHGRTAPPMSVMDSMSTPSAGTYRESGARLVERQEASSLREALEKIDQESDEERIHAAARDEAAELVWHHIHPEAAQKDKHPAYSNPDLLRASRKQSAGNLRNEDVPGNRLSASSTQRGRLTHSLSWNSGASSTQGDHHQLSQPERYGRTGNLGYDNARAPQNQPSIIVTDDSTAQANRRRISSQRKISGGSNRNAFPNRDDQIYEDSNSVSPAIEKASISGPKITIPLRPTNRNSILGARPLPVRAVTTESKQAMSHDRFEIYKNPPTQSRGAGYTLNPPVSSVEMIPEVEIHIKNGIEIRGEDIRAATSMRRRDRSPKLPTPTAVTDCPERPIASFSPRWQSESAAKDSEVELGRPGPRPIANQPAMAISAPIVPTINVESVQEPPDQLVPMIKTPAHGPNLGRPGSRPTATQSTMAVSAPAIPTISIEDVEEPPNPSLPIIEIPMDGSRAAVASNAPTTPSSSTVASQPPRRPLPRPSATTPGKLPTMKSPSRMSPLNSLFRSKTSTATCTSCDLPISGRIVTAAGAGSSSVSLKARFHPECFTCHHCSTGLECVAFYPEPEDKRNQRLEAAGISEANVEGELRFYCHLDFHELFSPRCKSCKTPIEGQVIVAVGAQWHPGHFFCSECGDPFDSNTPFVEKDSYAYCVSCHTRRTSARCRACKKQILDETTVQALGGHWHSACFNCYECEGDFGDEGRFFVRDITVEGTDKEKRRGITTRVEERAVCEACEKRRLKA